MSDRPVLSVAVRIGDTPLGERLADLLAAVPGLRIAGFGEVPDLVLSPGETVSVASDLTARELEVIALLAEGISNKEIAARLGIAIDTAKFHVGRVIDKLDATSRTDAVAHAARRGVIHLRRAPTCWPCLPTPTGRPKIRATPIRARSWASSMAHGEITPSALPERTGMIPVLIGWIGYHARSYGDDIVRLVPTPIACKLTGLSTEKLREWTSRRAIVPADICPKGKGTPAKFSWQSVLILRIAVLLRDQFNVELQAHKMSFDGLRKMLCENSFLSLWGSRLVLYPGGAWSLVEAESVPMAGDGILIALDPHLVVLRDGFALPDASEGQLDLFSLPAVRRARRSGSHAESTTKRHPA